MKQFKRALVLLLAAAVIWGVLPAGAFPLELPVQAASNTWNPGANPPVYKISTAEDWKKFAEWSYNTLETDNVKVTLENDIRIRGEIPMAILGGDFDGQNHTITLEDSAFFKADLVTSMFAPAIGLFSCVGYSSVVINKSGTLKNLVVKVEGNVDFILTDADYTMGSYKSIGVLVGEVISGQVENCAVIGEKDTSSFRMLVKGRERINVTRDIGGLVGTLNNGTVRRCYSDINLMYADGMYITYDIALKTKTLDFLKEIAPRSLGGVVGGVTGSSAAIIDCGYYNGTIETYMPAPHTESNKVSGLTIINHGGILGTNRGGASLTRCFSENVATRSSGLQTSWTGWNNQFPTQSEGQQVFIAWRDLTSIPDNMETFLGKVYIRSGQILAGLSGALVANPASVSGCYYDRCSVGNNSYTAGTNALPTANQLNTSGSTSTGVWTDTLYGAPNLTWLLAGSTKAESADVTIDSVASLLVTPEVPAPGRQWSVDATFPVKSLMPTPHGARLAPRASEKGITDLQPLGGVTSFAPGGIYAFQATVTGFLVPTSTDIEWGVGPGDKGSITDEGLLFINQDASGPITVTATLSGYPDIKKAYVVNVTAAAASKKATAPLVADKTDAENAAPAVYVFPGQKVALEVEPPSDIVGSWKVKWPDSGTMTGTFSGGEDLTCTYTAPSAGLADDVTFNITAQRVVSTGDPPAPLHACFKMGPEALPTPNPVKAGPATDGYAAFFEGWTLPEDQTDTAESYLYTIGTAASQPYNKDTGIPITAPVGGTGRVNLTIWTGVGNSAYRTESRKLTYEIIWRDNAPQSIALATLSSGTQAEDTEISAIGQTHTVTGATYVVDYPTIAPTSMNLDTLLKTDTAASPKERAAGQVTVKVYDPNGDTNLGTISGLSKNLFREGTSGEGSGGGKAPMPSIYPAMGQQIDVAKGVTIEVSGSGSYQVLYDTHTTNQGGQPRGAAGYPATSEFKPYPPDEGKINFPEGSSVAYFEVWAYTDAPGPSTQASGIAYRLYEKDTDLPLPSPPTIYLQNADGTETQYSESGVYGAGSTISFQHPDLADGVVYYTFGISSDPTDPAGSRRPYDDTKKPVLPSGNNDTIYLKAYFVNTKYNLVSAVTTATIRISPTLDPPKPSLDGGSPIKSGQMLTLTLPDATLLKLDPQFGSSGAFLARVYYGEDGALHGPLGADGQPTALPSWVVADSADNVTVDRNNPPVPGTEYISVLFSGDYLMPEIRYIMGDGTVDKNSLQGFYGMRKVTSVMENGALRYMVSYQQPTYLLLEGDAGKSVTVKAMTRSMAANVADSSAETYTYHVLPKAAEPKASPETSQDKVYTMRPDGSIKLSCTTAGAKIYYTDDDTLPSLDAAGRPTGTTKLYDASTGIPMNKDALTFYTIRAFAIADGYSQSDTIMLPYQLPARVQAVMASPNGGDDVVEGTKVTLSCSTEGAVIYYTTDGSEPVPYSSLTYSSPIQINDDLTIRTIAEKEGMQSIETTYDYDIASKLKAPTASLDSGSVVYKGSRISLSGRKTIAYTVDGSDPTVILKEESSSSGSGSGTNITVTTGDKEKEDQVLFGDSVVVNADYGDSLTVTAFCYGSGYTPSSTSTFTYSVCEKEDYLTAVPPTDSVLRPGDTVTLTTSLTKGKIYYTVNGDAPRVRSSGDSYRWSARSGDTVEGGTVPVTGEPGSVFTIRATAVQNGADGGTTVVFTYKLADRTPAPTASIPDGAITMEGAQVALTVQEGDIFYTTDGSDPTTSSTLYTGPVQVTGSMVLKAIAVAQGKEPSAIVQYVYTMAGQVAAPKMSLTGGEIEQGDRVELTTSTAGATIYYTTDGSEPTSQSLIYTSPITIMRPVTLKAKAILTGLHDSVVNSATYTVREPAKPREAESGSVQHGLQTDRLQSRRTFSEEVEGPTFTGHILTDAQSNTILAAQEGTLPEDAQLVVRPVEPSGGDRKAVEAQLGYGIAAAFDVTLVRGGEVVQPDGEVEIGLAIPSEYQNAIVVICYLGDDGSIEAFPTRRAGGIAYAVVPHLSKYAVTVPQAVQASGPAAGYLPAYLGLGGSALLILAVFLLWRRRKRNQGEV